MIRIKVIDVSYAVIALAATGHAVTGVPIQNSCLLVKYQSMWNGGCTGQTSLSWMHKSCVSLNLLNPGILELIRQLLLDSTQDGSEQVYPGGPDCSPQSDLCQKMLNMSISLRTSESHCTPCVKLLLIRSTLISIDVLKTNGSTYLKQIVFQIQVPRLLQMRNSWS